MKLVSDELGRVVQLFVPDEIAPFGGIYLPELFELISKRFGFVKQSDIADALKIGAKFEIGQLKVGEKKINIKELAIHQDGIVVDTRNTDDSSIVVDEMFRWGKQTLGLRDLETKRPRRYLSFVVVDFDKPIDNALKGFEAIRRNLSNAYKSTYETDVSYDLYRVSLAVDSQSLPPQTATEFTIERRINVPHSKNRFFCTAPLPTKSHLVLLEEIEREFVG